MNNPFDNSHRTADNKAPVKAVSNKPAPQASGGVAKRGGTPASASTGSRGSKGSKGSGGAAAAAAAAAIKKEEVKTKKKDKPIVIDSDSEDSEDRPRVEGPREGS